MLRIASLMKGAPVASAAGAGPGGAAAPGDSAGWGISAKAYFTTEVHPGTAPPGPWWWGLGRCWAGAGSLRGAGPRPIASGSNAGGGITAIRLFQLPLIGIGSTAAPILGRLHGFTTP